VAKILSIDLGTTYFKLSLFDRSGSLLDTCRLAPPLIAAREGWLELPAEALSAVIAQGIAQLRRQASGGTDDVEAVTFASQTNSFVLLDADDRPLTPLILWPDRRAFPLDAAVRELCSMPGFAETTGLARINFECMAAKLLWLQQESREIWRRHRRLCLISDYLTLLFTGKHVTEAGAAGLTGLINIHRCQWYSEMLRRFRIDAEALPSIARAGTDLGPIASVAAGAFGLPASCRFVLGCLDQYAGAIGTGNVEPGMLSETTGTVLATVQCCDRFDEQAATTVYQGPAFREGIYWKMTFGDVSANYLESFRARLPDRPEFDQLIALAATVEPGAEGLRLKTDLGTRCLEQAFACRSDRHTRAHQVRCILEAVAQALSRQIELLTANSPPSEVRCAGGGARSNLWLQIKADMLGITTRTTHCPEPTSLGAAILAEAALAGSDIASVARRWVSLKPPHHPDPRLHSQYRKLLCR
jgi:xylulokinase